MNKLTIQEEITLLRSAVIGLVGKDAEGEYQSEFVRSTFAALKRKSTKRFVSSRRFLASLKHT